MHGLSVSDLLSGQLTGLCKVLGLDRTKPVDLLRDLLGGNGSRSLSAPPAWPSNVADDHTPVEFSLAFGKTESPSLRILGEVLGAPPGRRSNMAAGYEFVDSQAGKYGFSTARLDAVRDLFSTEDPQGVFGLWCSLVFRSRREPELKVYLNPEVHGTASAPSLVSEALHRLGMGGSVQALLENVIRPGELGLSDRLSFFALDLHDGPQARVKLYVTHYHAEVRDVVRAASAVHGADPTEVAEFCAFAGGTSRFAGRPLVSSFTLAKGADRPVGYSIYVPTRSYVNDDQEARDRMAALLDRYGFDWTILDRAIAQVTNRPLREGVGLIPHASLRLGPPRPGVTVYLSAEAYHVKPPRLRQIPVPRTPAELSSSRAAAVSH